MRDINRTVDIQTSVFTAILAERGRQRSLAESGELPFEISDDRCSSGASLAILVEEVGEVAEELQTAVDPDNRQERDEATLRLFHELVQVAAVAVGWCERLVRQYGIDVRVIHRSPDSRSS